MRPVWLLDFDGVVNALSARGGRAFWDDWNQAVFRHPDGDSFPLLWSSTVVDTVAEAVSAGVDVRWLTTWRAHTAWLPELIPGLPHLPFLDETAFGESPPANPEDRRYCGPWKAAAAAVSVPDSSPLLWTDDSFQVETLAKSWFRRRQRPSTFISPRSETGLVRREIREIREWISENT